MEKPSDDFQVNDDPIYSKVSPLADIVSLETVVNVLIQKGICTPEELFEEERRLREYDKKFKDVKMVRTTPDAAQLQREEMRKKQTWLKRKMSKHRWSRRLGTRLFGWQWKKVRIEPHEGKSNHS